MDFVPGWKKLHQALLGMQPSPASSPGEASSVSLAHLSLYRVAGPKDQNPETGLQDCFEVGLCWLSPTILCHTNPGFMAVSFMPGSFEPEAVSTERGHPVTHPD